MITLYIRPGKNIEPLDYRSTYESFRQWKSKTAILLSEQINAGTGQEFERRVDRAAAFARRPGLEMMEQMDVAQQFLESLKGKLRYDPEQAFAGQND